MMMISAWSGIRIWRPSIEVSSSAENCNLEKRNVREFIEKKKQKQESRKRLNHLPAIPQL